MLVSPYFVIQHITSVVMAQEMFPFLLIFGDKMYSKEMIFGVSLICNHADIAPFIFSF